MNFPRLVARRTRALVRRLTGLRRLLRRLGRRGALVVLRLRGRRLAMVDAPVFFLVVRFFVRFLLARLVRFLAIFFAFFEGLTTVTVYGLRRAMMVHPTRPRLVALSLPPETCHTQASPDGALRASTPEPKS
jgi:hypothetical protein